MNGIKRVSLLVGMLLAVTGIFGNVARAERAASSTPAEVAASFDQKYLLPDYIAYSGIEALAEQALAIREVTSFDARHLAAGVAYARATAIEESADSTVAHDVHRQATTEPFIQYGMHTVDDEAIATAAAFDVNYFTPGSIVRTLEPEIARVNAARWQAMAVYFQQNGLLIVDNGPLPVISITH